MAISLNKGANIALQNVIDDFFMIGVGWKTQTGQIDIDVSAFLVNDKWKVPSDDDFIFYNQLSSQCGAVQLSAEPVNNNQSAFFIKLRVIPRSL